jgi:branched-chain amino acid transport system permease protein
LITDIVQQLLNGLLVGSTYALIGIGFTLIWGFMRRFNVAYGATAIGAAFIGLAVHRAAPSLPLAVPFLAAMASGAVLGYAVDLVSFRYLPKDYELAPAMSTLGVLFLIEEAISHATEGRPQDFPALIQASIHAGPYFVRGDYVVVFVLSVGIVAGLYWVLFSTRLGLALRATAQQPTAAQLMGINPVRCDAQAFMLTGALAGAAGMLLSMGVGTANADLATAYTVRGLTVAVIGGLGSIPGAIVGGLLVGVIEFQALGFQKPRPQIWCAAWTPQGLRRAGRIGDRWITDVINTLTTFNMFADIYRKSAQENGQTPGITVLRECWVAPTMDQAIEEYGPYVMTSHRFYYDVGGYNEQVDPWLKDLKSPDEFTIDKVAPDRFIMGSPEDCIEQIEKWNRDLGTDYFVMRFRHPNGPDHKKAVEAIKLFGEKVIPHFA